VLGVVVVLATAAFVATRRIDADNERQLLSAQADQLGQLVDSLASQEQGAVVAAAVVADHTNGDPVAFRSLVAASSGGQAPQGWALLTRHGTELTAATTVGTDANSLVIFRNPGPAVTARIMQAFEGKFEVVGIFGAGLTRRLVLAGGVPGMANSFVAYYEIPLIQAASQTAAQSAQSSGVGSDINIALYVGTPNPGSLVFSTGRLSGPQVVRSVSIGDSTMSYVVWAQHPLAGPLSTDLPWLALGFLLVGGVAIAVVFEMNLRKRDAALRLVDELDAAWAQRDLADQQRAGLEAELRQAQRLDAAGQLAGGVAHDFNNLLAAIMNYAGLVAEDLGDHPSRADVEEIRHAARRGARLTSQLLQFGSRAHRADETTDLNGAIDELHPLLARAVGEEIELRSDQAPNLPEVLLAAGDVEQVLMNLVVNARDAIDGPGTITITTEVAGTDADDFGVRLVVSDTGAGMEPDVAARIFEPFFTTKERSRGTGLGLATVYGIVNRADGKITVQSSPGLGTVFEVLLRAASSPTHAEPPDAAMAPAVPAADGQIILLVEDEDSVRTPTRRMLERAGYQVIEARDGDQALAGWASAHVDVVLTDVLMPGGVSGKDLADQLQGARPGLPVVFMSGYPADLLARRGVNEKGPTHLLQKPFTEDELLAAVANALQALTSTLRAAPSPL
jgi:signal transduction histidine kinase/ActR/RegA family two-component response regulator